MIQAFKYQFYTKIAAILLLVGILMPTGLHALSLVDFCTTDMEMASGMMSQDECHAMEDNMDMAESDHASHHSCGESVCTCHIGPASQMDSVWVSPKLMDFTIRLVKAGLTPDVQKNSFNRLLPYTVSYNAPPLFLLNSTFLN